MFEDSCDIVACVQCIDEALCQSCANDFVLHPSGRKCVLPAEALMIAVAQGVVVLLGVVIALGMLLKVGFVVTAARSHRSKGKRKRSKGATTREAQPLQEGLLEDSVLNLSLKALNAQAIRLGMANWYRARMMHERTALEIDPTQDPDLVLGKESRFLRCCSLFCDVHTKFIVGVGLPVFYNFHVLPAVAALFTMLAVHQSLSTSGYAKLDEDTSLEERERVAMHFAALLRDNLFLLYWAMLVMASLHAEGQKRWRAHFDRTNSTVEDFTLSLRGLPRSITSEAEVQQCLEKAFGLELVGVSIGYDISDPDASFMVWRMTERILIDRDSSLSLPGEDGGFGYDADLADPFELGLIREGRDREDFRKMLPKLRGSGLAWAVFRSKAQLDHVRTTWRGVWFDVEVAVESGSEQLAFDRALSATSRLSGRTYLLRPVSLGGEVFDRGTVINSISTVGGRRIAKLSKFVKLYHTPTEPPSVLWENLGVHRTETQKRLTRTVAITFVVFVLLLIVIFMPLGFFLLQPYAAAHAAPGFLTQQLQGFIFGLANNILGITMWIGAWGVGFKAWDQLNFFVVMFGVAVSFFNTVFFLGFGLSPELQGFCAVPLAHPGGLVSTTPLPGNASRAELLSGAFTAEEQLADTFYDTLVPGWLFSGFVMGQAMGNIWPSVQNLLLLLAVFACDCLPYRIAKVLMMLVPYSPQPSEAIGQSRLTARQAELVFQPKDLSLAWDYASYIVMPTVSFASLFVLSPKMGAIFPVMLGWVVFMYWFHRLVTLRVSKKQMYASENLVIGAELLWSVPLATVASAWAYWGYRLGLNPIGRIPLAVLGSCLLYFGGMSLAGTMRNPHVYGEIDVDYWRVAQRLRFSWFNCNPIHVLKSLYCPEAFGGPHVVARTPFAFGKEYLFEEAGGADAPESAS